MEKMSPEKMSELMSQIQNTMSGKEVQSNNQNILPSFLLPKYKRVLVDEKTETYIHIKEMTTLDYVIVKNLLKNDNIDDEITLNLFLTAHSMEKIEYKDDKGNISSITLPQVKTIQDYYMRMRISPSYWSKIQEAVSELNNNADIETLKK